MLYKYFPPERIDVIENRRVRFTSLVSLNDPFEYLMKVGEHEYVVDPLRAENPTKFMSLSRNHQNLLMWSHYADSHRGLVVAFPRTHRYFNRAEAVRYRRQRSDLNGAKLHTVTPEGVTKAISLEKAIDWAYEEEERLFLSDVPNDVTTVGLDYWQQPIVLNSFPEDSVEAVFLGVRASDELLERIREALSTYSNAVSIYRASLARGEFAVSFEKVDEV